MKKKILTLLSGLMIGSSLFAGPKKRNACDNENNSMYDAVDLSLMMMEWRLARPTKGTKAEYYSRMEAEALGGLSIKDCYDHITVLAGLVAFPLERKISKTFLSLLRYYLPNYCVNAEVWRKMIVTCMLKFRSGETDIATIKAEMNKFCVNANNGKIVFAHHANGLVVLGLVLYELKRLTGIVQ